ncbi:hypothetical protein AB0I81_22950 [Nonomuraea sp. NPDC050404]|uniref:hypothetical protein n=1 Tax=Nonomuraea sp. NPDC050404 TaxID=3155783 RepID=UPI0033FE644C
MSGAVKIDRRLYLVEDKSRVVEAGDPDARWLLCAAGGEVSRADAERYGLLDEPKPEPEPEPEEKAATAPANKSRRPSANK